MFTSTYILPPLVALVCLHLVYIAGNVSLRIVQLGFAAMMWAAHYGHLDVVRALLQANADVNLQGEVSEISCM